MYTYVHDINARIVYRFLTEPDITEQRDNRGRHTGWHVTMEIRITRAENWLSDTAGWFYPTSKNPSEYFFPQDTKAQALSYFRATHEPEGVTIGIDEYDQFHQIYESEAKSRMKPIQGI